MSEKSDNGDDSEGSNGDDSRAEVEEVVPRFEGQVVTNSGDTSDKDSGSSEGDNE